ncbi:MAG: serine/threonine-protein kinase [Polyangiaceae bacterium]
MSGGKDDTVLAPAKGGTRFGDGHATEPIEGVPKVGDVVAGKYRVDAILGVGGMGVVLAVTHTTIGEAYAMKCLLPGGATDPETIARFRREAQAAVRIKSEHIARVSDFGELENGAPYLLMEFLSGRDLGEVLELVGRLAVEDAVEYVLQACAGIAEAHALGIVHRDLKPSNLFLTQRLDGAALVKVLDFGISKAIDRDIGPRNAALTQTTSVFGSPAYMSPEQLRSTKNVDYRADVWGLGVILYELLAGTTPFKAETGSGLLAAIAADPPESLRAHRPEVSAELEAVVMRCLEKDVKRRWQRVSDLAIALEPFRGDHSLVSIGRIVRLSGPPSGPLPGLQIAPARTSGELPAIGSATDGPVTTGARGRAAKRSRATAVLVFAGAAAAIGGGAAFLARPPASPSAASHERATTETLPAPSPLPSASPSPSPALEPVPPPTASADPSTRKASPGAASAGSSESAAGKRRPAAPGATVPRVVKPSAPVAPAPVAPPTTAAPPPPEKPRDPTAESH